MNHGMLYAHNNTFQQAKCEMIPKFDNTGFLNTKANLKRERHLLPLVFYAGTLELRKKMRHTDTAVSTEGLQMYTGYEMITNDHWGRRERGIQDTLHNFCAKSANPDFLKSNPNLQRV